MLPITVTAAASVKAQYAVQAIQMFADEISGLLHDAVVGCSERISA
ncbi:hypothetical protein [Blastococcus deserti]|uniref:Uncharacterized protein n=1 Tax=Blastococcus deserti TaxID=2259033 RepID=A0ABW4XFX1_9ACTN